MEKDEHTHTHTHKPQQTVRRCAQIHIHCLWMCLCCLCCVFCCLEVFTSGSLCVFIPTPTSLQCSLTQFNATQPNVSKISLFDGTTCQSLPPCFLRFYDFLLVLFCLFAAFHSHNNVIITHPHLIYICIHRWMGICSHTCVFCVCE